MVGALSLTYWHVELGWALRCMVGALCLNYWHVESSFWLELCCLTPVDLEVLKPCRNRQYNVFSYLKCLNKISPSETCQYNSNVLTIHGCNFSCCRLLSYEWGTMIWSRVSTQLCSPVALNGALCAISFPLLNFILCWASLLSGYASCIVLF
jgi:hypothetical protein